VSRYKDDLKKSMPEVDSFISVDEILEVGKAAGSNGEVAGLLAEAARPYFLYDDSMPRHLASLPHTAYVKISEGCNRPCTFCVIPKIRGTMRSRTLESVVQEVKNLGNAGVREINLVAQDLTSYGTDSRGPGLSDLLHALDRTEAVDWIRLLYAYPIGIDDKLLDSIISLPRVCEYLDLPLQHSSEAVLKEMKLPLGRYSPRKIIEYINQRAPEIFMRTTFIVGFPGETEKDVEDLAAFVAEGHFSSVGVFTYSHEQGTPSYDMPGQVSEKEKKARRDYVMKAQQRVVDENLENLVGSRFEVLVEGTHEETDLLLSGRTRFQAPEVDGAVIINDIPPEVSDVKPGQIWEVEITEVAGYDLIGSLVRKFR
jgi:ribosomal protein S12 methylthiotransferase